MGRILDFLKTAPGVPTSAVLFYLVLLILWWVGYLPSPEHILGFLETLYNQFGLIGLFIAAFLEGIVYLGMYFPGSFIVALAVIVSDGTLLSFLQISTIVALALFVTSLFNYRLGHRLPTTKRQAEKFKQQHGIIEKGFFPAILHPVPLAFYFFSAGLHHKGFYKVFLVPLVIIPYGIILATIVFAFKEAFRNFVENPYALFFLLLIWLAMEWVFQYYSVRNSTTTS